MRLLLDTHIWIWSLSRPAKLRRPVARAIESPRNELRLSPVSIWEVIVLTEKGRLKHIRDGLEWIDKARRELPVLDAPLTAEVAREACLVRLGTGDPADRLIVATARAHQCTLVTSDEALIASGLVDTLAN